MITVNDFMIKKSSFTQTLLNEINNALKEQLKTYAGEKEIRVEIPNLKPDFIQIIQDAYKSAGFLSIQYREEEYARDTHQVHIAKFVIFTIY